MKENRIDRLIKKALQSIGVIILLGLIYGLIQWLGIIGAILCVIGAFFIIAIALDSQ